MIYANARAFRQALNDRLSSLANIQQMAVSRLQRKVAFERFLARVSRHMGEQLVLKGGYALELRLGSKARSTVDLDFSTTRPRLVRTRVKDLVDLMLIIEVLGLQPDAQSRGALKAVFDCYQSHDLPTSHSLEVPPVEWRDPFAVLAAEGQIQINLSTAHQRLVEWLGQLEGQ